DSLTNEQRLMIEAVAQAECSLGSAEYNARNNESLTKLVNEHGVQLKRFSDEILTEFGKYSNEVVAEIGNSDPFTKRVWESFLKYRKEAIAWSKIGEQGYMNARLLPFEYG